MEVKQDEMTQELWDEWQAFIQDQVCAECGGELTIRTVPERASMELACPHPDHHTGFRQRESFTQLMRRGAAIHPAIQQNIETKMMPKTEFTRAINLLALRYPDAVKDEAGASLFINDCIRLGLDPLIQPSEAIPIPFKTKGKNGKEKISVAMIVTEDGTLSMAARGCPEEFDGAPATMPLLNYLMLEHPHRPFEELEKMSARTAASLCDDENAYVWVALGKRRSASTVQPVYGYYTTEEKEKAKKSRLPAGSQPGNQARVRAVKRWVRENFPEARQKMIEYSREFYDRNEGALAAQEFIDAEYSILTGPAIKPVPAAANPETKSLLQPVDDGLAIDVTWLKDALAHIKWSEETTKSWILVHLGADIKGDLIEGISRLPREDAEKFINEIRERSESIQPEIF